MLVRTSLVLVLATSLSSVTAFGAVIRTPVSIAGAQDVVFDTVRNRIYVPTGTGSVARYDMATHALLPSWQGGVNLRGADMTADGAFLYVADQSSGAAQGVIRKINADTGTRTNLFYDMAGEGAGAYDLVRLSTNKMMFTTNHQFSGDSTPVRFIDLSNDAITVRAGDAVERQTDLFRSGDGTRVFMTGGNTSAGNIRVYDAPTDSYLVNTLLNTPLNGISAALSPNGELLAFQGFNVPLALQRSTDLSVIETFPHYRSGLGFSPNGLLVMADWETELFRVYDPATQSEVGTFPAGFDLDPFLVGNLAFSGDGATMVFQTPDGINIYEGIPVPEPTLVLLPLAALVALRPSKLAVTSARRAYDVGRGWGGLTMQPGAMAMSLDDDLDHLSREQLVAEVKRLRRGIREHRDSSGHELCWHHPALWSLLPEKSDPLPVVPDWPQFMRGCIKYRQSLDAQLPDAPRSQQEAPG